MSLVLKDGVNFPPEEEESNKIIIGLSIDLIQRGYREEHILEFIKTGSGLKSQQNEIYGNDESSGWSSERKEIIKKYINIVSLLWQNKSVGEVSRYINQNFENIEGIDIQAEIETGRKQKLTNLGRATKDAIFNIVDPKPLLEKSEKLEFNTPKEIFLFVVNLLGYDNMINYLTSREPSLKFPIKTGEISDIRAVCRVIIRQNSLFQKYCEKQIPGLFEHENEGEVSIRERLIELRLNEKDLEKIRLQEEKDPN